MSNYTELQTCYVTHRGEFFGVALKLTRNREAAQDLVSEMLLKACAKWNLYKQGTNLRAWLFRILRNIFLSDRRRALCHARYVEATKMMPAPKVSNVVEQIIAEEDTALLHQAITKLSPNHREIVELTEFQDKKYQEAAEQLSIPLGTVMSRLYRAKQQLADELLCNAA